MSTSGAPSSSRICANSFATCAASVASAAYARPPTACAIGSTVSRLRATMPTLNPSRAKRRATAAPSPGPAPITMAIFDMRQLYPASAEPQPEVRPGSVRAACNFTLCMRSAEAEAKRSRCANHSEALLPRVLLLVLAMAHATGLAEVIRRQACEAECRNDGCDDDCTPSDSPSCPCHCPSLQTQIAPLVAAVAIAPATQAAPPHDGDDGFHPSPDPREISHVPRHAVCHPGPAAAPRARAARHRDRATAGHRDDRRAGDLDGVHLARAADL